MGLVPSMRRQPMQEATPVIPSATTPQITSTSRTGAQKASAREPTGSALPLGRALRRIHRLYVLRTESLIRRNEFLGYLLPRQHIWLPVSTGELLSSG